MKNKKIVILLAVSFAAVVLYVLERTTRTVSEAVNSTVGAFFRLLFSEFSKIFPFSLFWLIIASGIVLAICFLVAAIKSLKSKKATPMLKKTGLAIVAALLVIFDLFTLTFAPAYNTKSTAERMSLSENITEEEVFSAFEFICRKMASDEKLIVRDENGVAQNLHTFSETEKLVLAAADAFSDEYPFYQKGVGTAKKTPFSKPLSYTLITGIYGFFTGESNINTAFPEISLPTTMAHEFSHARGVAYESDCNFLAFAICLGSDDPFLRYSAEFFILDDLMKACKTANEKRYTEESYFLIPKNFFNDYKYYANAIMSLVTPVATVSDAVNSAYLKSQGQKDGTVSYSKIVEISTAYIISLIQKGK